MISYRRIARIVVCFLCLLLTLTECKKASGDAEDPGPDSLATERPGQIAGFGEAPGAPTGSPFALPNGVTLASPIVGREDGRHQEDCAFDGPGFWVTVSMTLQRDSTGTGPITVEFPPGLVITTASEGFQHGLLVERVVVTVPPNMPGPGGSNSGRCQATLMLSCMNAARKTANASARFKLGPVTNSPLILDFIKRLSTKKILYSAFGVEDETWFENQERIQAALWHLTDGDGLTASDLDYIRNLPNK